MNQSLVNRVLATDDAAASLALRIPVGIIFAAHGAQKLFGWFGGYGLEGTGQFFGSVGLSPGYLMAMLAGAAEFFGGLALVFGLLVRPAAAALAFAMLVAVFAVHFSKGFFLDKGGYEYALALFVSHGAPSFALEPGLAGLRLTALGRTLPRPQAVLVVSPHWMTPTPRVGASLQPTTIHDFGGFDPALYELSCPARGHAALAQRSVELLNAAGWAAQADERRGLHDRTARLHRARADGDAAQDLSRAGRVMRARSQAGRSARSRRQHSWRVVLDPVGQAAHTPVRVALQRREHGPGDHDCAGIDIFRFENGKIVEHWDVLQVVPERSLNDNGMF